MTLMSPAAARRTCSVQLTLDLAAPRAARRLLLLLLTQWGVDDPDVHDGASIVVSELITNVLVHCDDGGPATLDIELHETRLVLSVLDGSPVVPTQRTPDDEAESGRGLGIISQIASGWGIEPRPTGKRVYAELPLLTACLA